MKKMLLLLIFLLIPSANAITYPSMPLYKNTKYYFVYSPEPVTVNGIATHYILDYNMPFEQICPNLSLSDNRSYFIYTVEEKLNNCSGFCWCPSWDTMKNYLCGNGSVNRRSMKDWVENKTFYLKYPISEDVVLNLTYGETIYGIWFSNSEDDRDCESPGVMFEYKFYEIFPNGTSKLLDSEEVTSYPLSSANTCPLVFDIGTECKFTRPWNFNVSRACFLDSTPEQYHVYIHAGSTIAIQVIPTRSERGHIIYYGTRETPTWVSFGEPYLSPPTPPTQVCRPCNYELLDRTKPIQYFYTGICLIVNMILCNPIMFAIVALLFIFVWFFVDLYRRWKSF